MVDKNTDEAGGGAGEYDFAPQEPTSPREETPAPQPVRKPRESSRPVPTTAAPPVSPQVLAERICPHCGFKIFGTPLRGRCPECAARLDENAADRLQFSDVAWLTTVSNGTLLAALGVLLLAVGTVLGWMGKGDLGAMVHVVAGVSVAAGIWLATQTEPASSAKQSPVAPWARWVAVAVAAFWLIPLANRGAASGGRDFVVIAALVAMGIAALLACLYLRKLAVRVPNDSVAAQFWNLAIGLPIVCLALILLQLTGLADLRKIDQYFLCGFSTIGALAVVVLWTAITFLRLGIELRNCVAAGQAIEARKAMKAQAQEKK